MQSFTRKFVMKNDISPKDSVNDSEEDEGNNFKYIPDIVGGKEGDSTSAMKEEAVVGSIDLLLKEVGTVREADTCLDNTGVIFVCKNGLIGTTQKVTLDIYVDTCPEGIKFQKRIIVSTMYNLCPVW